MKPIPEITEFLVNDVWIQIFEADLVPSENILRFEVTDLEVEHTHITQLGIECSKIEDVPEVIRYFDLKDPDGNQLSVYWLYPEH